MIVTFSNYTIVTPPTGFVVGQEDFKVYINGQFVSTNLRTVVQSGLSIEVTFLGLEYPIDINDQVVLVGKFN